MSTSIKVSVIVAAYNSEKYLKETLETLVHQSLDQYEIIVVNDGSTDTTIDILNEYAKEYDFLSVIDKENGGPSSARNAGLDVAKGDYIYFFDADDLLELTALEEMFSLAEKKHADLVIAKYDIFNRYKTTPVRDLDELVTEKKIGKYDTRILWSFSLCNKLFKRELIENCQLRLPPISYSEDGAFLFQYLFHCKKIAGLDMVIFHYRRLFDGEAESITASVSPAKIKDYTTAHHMIYQSAAKSILNDFPQYDDIEALKEENAEMRLYLNTILRKELQILLTQFYPKFWTLDIETIELLANEVEEKLALMDMNSISTLINDHPQFSLSHLPRTWEQAREQAHFTVALYGDRETEEDFLETLTSLENQTLITLLIAVPEAMKESIATAELMQENIIFYPAATENELFYTMVKNAKTPYITFSHVKFTYVNNAFKRLFDQFHKNPSVDYLIELIYHDNYGDIQAILLNDVALNSVKIGYKYNERLAAADRTIHNKFFRTEFLKEHHFDETKPPEQYLEYFYHSGYFLFMNDAIIVYKDTEKSFISFIGTEKTIPEIKEYLREEPLKHLGDETLARHNSEVISKLNRFPTRNLFEKFYKKLVSLIRRNRVKRKVSFISIRKNKQLEGNALALYPYVKGKKVICAKMLPHGFLTRLRMFYHIFTSKVIITDDYVRYLRYFPLKKNQIVIQLWHACGAFKKFGRRGTNVPVYTDSATHAQYNLVCVSGEKIRSIYADAFAIDINKVRALGTPRTDAFYDKELIKTSKEKIYEKYPEFRDKYIIIYAPTFRDVNGDRSVFQPELDFETLSKELLPDQMFLICPHPVMKNEIVEGTYDNIKVIRDFSTNDMMHVSDMLITDYSSVIFEYALLKKPIAFYCYDLPIYNRGFYLNYPEDLPGDVYENQHSLVEYLQQPEKHTITEKYTRFVEQYMSACDGHSCERIANLINDYVESDA